MVKTLYHGSEFVIKSEKAFSRLHFEGEESALRSDWLSRREERDQAARSAYFDSRRNPVSRGELMAFQIWQEGVKGDDPRLFRRLSYACAADARGHASRGRVSL